MAKVTENIAYVLSQPANYELFSRLRFGSNGGAGGAAELHGGSGPTDLTAGRITWDSDISSGLDSQLVSVSLILQAGSNRQLTWTVGGQVVSYSGPACDSILELELRSGVGAQAGIEWSDLQIRFLMQGSEMDSWSQSGELIVDLSGGSTPGELQRVLSIQPNSSADEVQLTGNVRIWAPQGIYPDADSIIAWLVARHEVA